jgi:hypothetical protein
MEAAEQPEWERRFVAALHTAERFFMGDARVQHAAREMAERLEKENIPYAIAGAMALNAHGYERVTSDVHVLLTREGLARFKAKFLGLGYVEKFPGSKGLRDTANNVAIDILLTGDYPGDGKEKPVRFPDPAEAAVRGREYRVLPVATLVEMKLASGMTAPHRLKDLADVIELVRAARLPLALMDELDPWVREKYLELWNAAQAVDPE